MIGCKVMRTLASVEIEIMLILGLLCFLGSSSATLLDVLRVALRILVDSRRMSTLVFVDPEISTQADGAQSSRVPVPLPEDPYEAIRQAYLDGTDTESEPFEDPIDTETPESPLTVAPPTSLPESTPPVLVPILRRTARMAVRVPPAMSSGLSASIAEVAAMSESVFCKRLRSSYESSPSVSPLDLPSWKCYRGTSELVEDSEEDDDEEDEEIKESIDSDSVSENAGDEGPTAEDEDPAAGDKGLTVKVEGLGMDDESYGLDDESHGMDDEGRGLDDKGHSVKSDGLSLEEEEEVVSRLALEKDHVYSTFEVRHGSGSAPTSERPERVSVLRQPTLTTWIDPEDGGLIRDHAVRLEELSPALFERYDRDIGELFTRSGAAGQTDAQRAAMWHAISDMQGENQDLRLQLAEERHARLELAKVVDGMRSGHEPKGDA
ncbi:hypothetical protein Tco_0112005 [Tanacetum coccineum]